MTCRTSSRCIGATTGARATTGRTGRVLIKQKNRMVCAAISFLSAKAILHMEVALAPIYSDDLDAVILPDAG